MMARMLSAPEPEPEPGAVALLLAHLAARTTRLGLLGLPALQCLPRPLRVGWLFVGWRLT